jgi:sugar phosphate isomerase/epimerase
MKRRKFNKLLISSLAIPSVVSLSSFTNAPYVPAMGCQTNLENAAAVKAAGGSFIGLSVAGWLDPEGPMDEFQGRIAEAAKAPLPAIVCNSFIRRKDLHVTGPDANLDEVMIYVEKAFQRAKLANVKMINFGSSGARNIPEGFSYEEAITQFISALKLMGPLAKKYGVTVGIEQLQSRECNFINRISEVERVVRGANHPNIRGVADFYHMAAEGDTPEDLAKAADLLMHVEIAELEGRRMVGVSGQDFRPYLKVLKKAKYKGALSVEGKFEVSELASGFAELKKQWLEA